MYLVYRIHDKYFGRAHCVLCRYCFCTRYILFTVPTRNPVRIFLHLIHTLGHCYCHRVSVTVSPTWMTCGRVPLTTLIVTAGRPTVVESYAVLSRTQPFNHDDRPTDFICLNMQPSLGVNNLVRTHNSTYLARTSNVLIGR